MKKKLLKKKDMERLHKLVNLIMTPFIVTVISGFILIIYFRYNLNLINYFKQCIDDNIIQATSFSFKCTLYASHIFLVMFCFGIFIIGSTLVLTRIARSLMGK